MGAAEALGGSIHDRLKHTLGILIEIVVPDTQDRPALFLEEAVTPLISLRFRMLAAVKFDDQPRLPARKIGEVRTDRQLTRKPRADPREDSPKFSLMFGGSVA